MLILIFGFLFMYFTAFRSETLHDLTTFTAKNVAEDVNRTDSTTNGRKVSVQIRSSRTAAPSKIELAKEIAGLVGSASPAAESAVDRQNYLEHMSIPSQDSSMTHAKSESSTAKSTQPASTSNHRNRRDPSSLSNYVIPPTLAGLASPAAENAVDSQKYLERVSIPSPDSSMMRTKSANSMAESPQGVSASNHRNWRDPNLLSDYVISPTTSGDTTGVDDAGIKSSSLSSASQPGPIGIGEIAVLQKKYGKQVEPLSREDSELTPLREPRLDQTISRGDAMTKELLERFKDLDPNEVPSEQYPLLSWNYSAVLDPNTGGQYFSLARGDHVATFKPLCLLPKLDKVVTKTNAKVCSGFNRTAGWMIQYCDTVEDAFHKESLLQRASSEELGSKEPSEWIDEQDAAGNVHWIDGLTIFHVYDRSCGNIAHFAGRALFLQHVIDNVQAYSAPPHTIENIVILPNADVMKRFRYPHNYGHWHNTLFRAVITPASYTIGTLGNFIYRTGKAPYNGIPRVQLVYDLSLAGSNLKDDQVICFRKAIVPGFLKSRFFVDDKEYPSTKPSLQSKLKGAPVISRDAIRLRERVGALLHRTTAIKPLSKRIIFVDRNGKRRNIPRQVKNGLFELLKAAAEQRGYKFEVVTFDNITFAEQVSAIEEAGVVIGVHGANLVNAMFMPPLSVLFELFPFQFTHGMYEEGGAAGLKYFSYQVSNGVPFSTAKQFKDAEQCIRFDHACKVHYRDAALEMNEGDFRAIAQILEKAMDWCETATSHANGQRARRRLASALSLKALRWRSRNADAH
jgi:Glycosyltransferase 61